MKILICQLRNHGDIIRTFPLIEALKLNYPNCFIGFTCIKEMKNTVNLCEDIDEIIIQPKLMPIKNHYDNTRICDYEPLEDIVYEIRRKNYDVYIDLHGVFQSSILGMLSEIPIRIGRSKHTTKDGAYLSYNYIANIESKDINRMERHFIIANEYFKDLKPICNAIKFNNRKEVAIIPGSSIKGILKRWDFEKYLQLINRLCKKNIVNVLLGPEETELFNKFNNYKTNTIRVKLITKWKEYCEIYKNCSYVVGNDSAALHIAIWKNIPTFMICGPTSSVINSVWKYSSGKGITSKEKCYCKDVWSGKCNNKHICMKNISVDMVFNEINYELDKIEGKIICKN